MGNSNSGHRQVFENLSLAEQYEEIRRFLTSRRYSNSNARQFRTLLQGCRIAEVATEGEDSLNLSNTFLPLLCGERNVQFRQILCELWSIGIDDEAFVALIRASDGTSYDDFLLKLETAEKKALFSSGESVTTHDKVTAKELFLCIMISLSCEHPAHVSRLVRALGFSAYQWAQLGWEIGRVESLVGICKYSCTFFESAVHKCMVIVHVASNAVAERQAIPEVVKLVSSATRALKPGWTVLHTGCNYGARYAAQFPNAIVFEPILNDKFHLSGGSICYLSTDSKVRGCDQSYVMPLAPLEPVLAKSIERNLYVYLGVGADDEDKPLVFDLLAKLGGLVNNKLAIDAGIPLFTFPKDMRVFIQSITSNLIAFVLCELDEDEASLLLSFSIKDEVLTLEDHTQILCLLERLLFHCHTTTQFYTAVTSTGLGELDDQSLDAQKSKTFYPLLKQHYDAQKQKKQRLQALSHLKASLKLVGEQTSESKAVDLPVEFAMQCVELGQRFNPAGQYLSDGTLFDSVGTRLVVHSPFVPMTDWVNSVLQRWSHGTLGRSLNMLVDFRQCVDAVDSEDDLELEAVLQAFLVACYPGFEQTPHFQQVVDYLLTRPQQVLVIAPYGVINQAKLAELKTLGFSLMLTCTVAQRSTLELFGFEQTVALAVLEDVSRQALRRHLPEKVACSSRMLMPHWVAQFQHLTKHGVNVGTFTSEVHLVSCWSRLAELEQADINALSELALKTFIAHSDACLLDLKFEFSGERCHILIECGLLRKVGDEGCVRFAEPNVLYHFASMGLLAQLVLEGDDARQQHMERLSKLAAFEHLWPYLIANTFRKGSPYESLYLTCLKKFFDASFKAFSLHIKALLFNLSEQIAKEHGFLLVTKYPELEVMLNEKALEAANAYVNRFKRERRSRGRHFDKTKRIDATRQLLDCLAISAEEDLGYDTNDMNTLANTWVNANGGFVMLEIPGSSGKTRASFILNQACQIAGESYVVAMLPNTETCSVMQDIHFAGPAYYLDRGVQAESRIAGLLRLLVPDFDRLKRVQSEGGDVVGAIDELIREEVGSKDELATAKFCAEKLNKCESVADLLQSIRENEEQTMRERYDLFSDLEQMTTFSAQKVNVMALFSMNTGVSHWVTVRLFIRKVENTFTCDVYSINPYGGSEKMHPVHYSRVKAALECGIKRIYPAQEVIVVHNCDNPYVAERQPREDGVSCGVVSHKDKTELAQGHDLLPYQVAEETGFQTMLRLRREQFANVERVSSESDKASELRFVDINKGRIRRYDREVVGRVKSTASVASAPVSRPSRELPGDSGRFDFNAWKSERDRNAHHETMFGLGGAFYIYRTYALTAIC